MAKCKNCKKYDTKARWCKTIDDSPDDEMERDCDRYERMTNADRIRFMSIDDLVELFYSFHNLEDKVKFCKNKPECDDILDSGKDIPDDMRKKCLAEWLQSEVEE